MMNFPIGARYCSMITVEGGKEFFSERMRARIATADRGEDQIWKRDPVAQRAHHRFLMSLESSFQRIPIFAGNAMVVGSHYM